MTARRVNESPQYLPSLRRMEVRARSPRSIAIRATVRALAAAETLPGPLDYQTLIPPVQRAWVRRVTGQNLWLYYRVREDVLHLVLVSSSPPVPLA